MEHDGCKLCKYENYSMESKECIGCKQNSVDKYKRMTQGDRIRAMSDAELAEFLPIVSDIMCKPTDKCMENIFNHGECEKTKECVLKWLQSEVEVEHER